MESSLPLENICGMEVTSLTSVEIRKIEVLECLPDGLFSNNHNLTKLEIYDCPKMTHLIPCFGGERAPSLLRELKIWNCWSLRELPDDLHSFNSLEILRIYLCRALTNLPIEMVESCAPSLEKLSLDGLTKITNLGKVIECLHKMTRLRELSIIGVPEFSITGSLSTTNSLQTLVISPSWSWKNNVSFNETFDAMLRQFISLRNLRLHWKKGWGSLPDQLQHLTSLEELTLDGFGIEALPEWFGNFSSLKSLELSNCKKLRHLPDQLQHLTSLEELYVHKYGIEALPEWFGNLSSLRQLYLFDCKKLRNLPSKQAMQRLSKLTLLVICGSPLLLKEKRSNDNDDGDEVPQIVDSEWPKISHIPTIELNYHRIPSGH